MQKPITGSRRSSIEIVREILAVCDGDEVNKTTIMYRSNLSYDQLRRYLSVLTEQDLISTHEDGRFGTTPRGHKMLKQASSLLKALGQPRGNRGKPQLRAQPAAVQGAVDV